MAITTVCRVKTLLSIRDSKEDDAIELLIPMVEDEIKSYCNNNFLINGSIVWPVGMEIIAVKMIAYHLANQLMIASETNGPNTVTYLQDYPQEIKNFLFKYRKL